ncbi:MAG: helix-turn-helix domain-containing protein [Pseudomonas sp.]
MNVKKQHMALQADSADAEDFDATPEALDRGQRARLIRTTRTGLGLSQVDFANRFHVPVGTLRDWEQARVTVPEFAVAYVRVIGLHPDMVTKAVA